MDSILMLAEPAEINRYIATTDEHHVRVGK